MSSDGEPYVDGPYACPRAEVTFEESFGPFLGGPGRPLSAEFATGTMTAPIRASEWEGAFVRTVVTPTP